MGQEDGLDAHVGSKCLNLWSMSQKMSSIVAVPPAVALPFASLHRVLAMQQHKQIAAALEQGNVMGSEASALIEQVCLFSDHGHCIPLLHALQYAAALSSVDAQRVTVAQQDKNQCIQHWEV